MQAIILSAGKGTRLGDLTSNCNKSMLEINGQTIISTALDKIASTGIKEVIIVIGYNGQAIEASIGNYYMGMLITYVQNDNFENANNIYSIWLCRNFLTRSDTMILEGDLIFDQEIIDNVLSSIDNTIVVAPLASAMNGSIVEIDHFQNMHFSKSSKIVDPNSKKYKTVNIYLFTQKFSQQVYVPLLAKEVLSGNLNQYYEDVLNTDIIRTFFKLQILSDNNKWFEIDTPSDLMIASVLFSKGERKYNELVMNYGGYWRFPKIADHYYLTNPFFPNQQMLNELKEALGELILNYPSGRTLLNTLATPIYKCEKKHLLVGNGSSEMIKILLNKLPGKFGVIVPTFEEYLNIIDPTKLVTLLPSSENFEVTIEELEILSNQVDCIIIVNPNNPTGSHLSSDLILQLLNILHSKGKYLILDESFADFFIGESILSSKNLNRFDNLFIIKSLGKSHGIPGIRCGLLFSSNNRYMEILKNSLPIWNTNSILEHYLEIFPRYQRQFEQSCAKVAEERDCFYNELKEVSYLIPYPSYANFILCEVTTGSITASEIVHILLEEFNILVKFCGSKKGFGKREFIRIGIKDRRSNKLLITALIQIRDKLGISQNIVVPTYAM